MVNQLLDQCIKSLQIPIPSTKRRIPRPHIKKSIEYKIKIKEFKFIIQPFLIRDVTSEIMGELSRNDFKDLKNAYSLEIRKIQYENKDWLYRTILISKYPLFTFKFRVNEYFKKNKIVEKLNLLVKNLNNKKFKGRYFISSYLIESP